MKIKEVFCEINNALNNISVSDSVVKDLLGEKPASSFTKEDESQLRETLEYIEKSVFRASKAIDNLQDTLYCFKEVEIKEAN